MSISHDEEEDFFDMLGKGDESEPPRLLQIDAVNAAVPIVDANALDLLEPYVSQNTQLSHDSHNREEEGLPSFANTLAAFYSKYNFGNLDKVEYLAEKFESRRWELWEQLCIKYKLSPNESRETWIKFNLLRDGQAACARRLFEREEAVTILEDSPSMRMTAWIKILAVIPSDTQVDAYQKYVAEIASQHGSFELGISEIKRDIERTHQELSFFHLEETQATLARILNVYCKVNGINYVQGMNEVLAVTLYAIRDEASSFWGFNCIMSQLKDLFTAEADSTQDGIYSRIDSLDALLRDYDYKLWKHLADIQFPLATMAMRWLTTLLSMDLHLPDTLRVWDVVLQSSGAHQLLTMSMCLSLAYLLCMSESLLTLSDPQDSMELASHFGRGPDFNVDDLVVKSLSVYAFESTLRGRYPALSDEPLLDSIVDVVGVAGTRVMEILNSEDIRRRRESLLKTVSTARESVAGWIDKVVPYSTVASAFAANQAREIQEVHVSDPSNDSPDMK